MRPAVLVGSFGLAALLFLALPSAAVPSAAVPTFRMAWSVPFVHAGDPGPNATYADIMGSGACVFDYDGDGWQDVLLVNGRYSNGSLQQQLDPRTQLYHNDQGRGFTLVPGALNVSAYGMGCAAGDYDGDGRIDVAISTWGGPLLFHNEGNGTFRNVTASAGIAHSLCGKEVCFDASLAWFDYDRDGRLDLFVTNYVAWDQKGAAAPNLYPGQCNFLYHNNGNGTFTDVADSAGAADCGRNHLALAIADVNHDGWQDVFIACDESSATLLRNNGNGTFTDITVDANVTDHRGGMGATWGDIEGDGRYDLAVSHFEGEFFGLFRQDPGALHFTDVARAQGLGGTNDYVGWGIRLADLNDDGAPDLMAADGHVNVSYGDHIGYGQRNLVLTNDGTGNFTDVTASAWLPAPVARVSRGLAQADLDQDGYLDAVFNNNANESAEMWRSERGANNWLELRLGGNATVNPSAVGAVVTAHVGGSTLRREVMAADSYLSQGSLDVLLGLGNATKVDDLAVAWPDGTAQSFGAQDANQLLTLQAGGQPAVLRARPLAATAGTVHGNRLDPVTLQGTVLRGANASTLWTVGNRSFPSATVQLNFTELGTYPATFRVTADDGTWDEAPLSVVVEDIPPVPRISAPATADRVHAAQLDGGASSDRDGRVVNWTWSVAGATLYGSAVNATFTALGDQRVTLTVRDDEGASASTTATVRVVNLPPVADAGPDLVGNLRSTFRFNASRSTDPDGSITAWAWDFGDGARATGQAATHGYASTGNFTVTLNVTDNDGASASAALRVTVNERDAPPVAVPGADRDADRVRAVAFDGSASYDPDGSITAWAWDFGDGGKASGASVQHTYAALGDFTVTLNVTDDTNSTGRASLVVHVRNLAPVVQALPGSARQEGLAPLNFTGNASDADGTIAGYAWDFGDGGTASGASVRHAYAAFGHYNVTLTVTDNEGASASTREALWLYARPVARPGPDRDADRVTDVPFDAAQSSDADGRVVAFHWDFGDGGSADTALAPHRYAQLGAFTATLTVTDDDGFTGTASVQVTVRNLPPVPRIRAYALANANQTLAYDASASTDPDGRVVSFAWDFGDGGTARGALVTHAFATPGNRTVRLTVLDNDGAAAAASLGVVVVDWLRVDVAMDRAWYTPLQQPHGTATVRFANGLPVAGADVGVVVTYRVQAPPGLGMPPVEVYRQALRGTTDGAGILSFDVPPVAQAAPGQPYLGVPTLSLLGQPLGDDRVAASAVWRGNAGSGVTAYSVHVVDQDLL